MPRRVAWEGILNQSSIPCYDGPTDCYAREKTEVMSIAPDGTGSMLFYGRAIHQEEIRCIRKVLTAEKYAKIKGGATA